MHPLYIVHYINVMETLKLKYPNSFWLLSNEIIKDKAKKIINNHTAYSHVKICQKEQRATYSCVRWLNST